MMYKIPIAAGFPILEVSLGVAAVAILGIASIIGKVALIRLIYKN